MGNDGRKHKEPFHDGLERTRGFADDRWLGICHFSMRTVNIRIRIRTPSINLKVHRKDLSNHQVKKVDNRYPSVNRFLHF